MQSNPAINLNGQDRIKYLPPKDASFEADDIIATFAKKAEAQGFEVLLSEVRYLIRQIKPENQS